MQQLKVCILILTLSLLQGSLIAQSGQQAMQVVFYNVENLFDTIDDPVKLDEEFTPASEKQWNTRRYEDKLDKLVRVIRGAAHGQAPELIGLCEVENRRVLEDLAGKTSLNEFDYGIVHEESPDVRGIDVALMYKKEKDGFSPLSHRALPLFFPTDSDYKSRDILYVKGLIGEERDTLHIFINHWPSRRGGVSASEPRRLVAANALRAAVDTLMQHYDDPNILIMGDFNDDIDNKSISQVLGASVSFGDLQEESLYNLMYKLRARERGTYNYRGNWDMLDQFIVSEALLNKQEDPYTLIEETEIFMREWMMYEDKRYGSRPSRTYGGPNYYGGFSDHLPIRMTLYTD